LMLDFSGVITKWLYMYAYSLYLFFDFAGYSLFAIAFSYIYGIQTPQNFNQPFKAKNIKDFWNRWHMSLSFLFRVCISMRSLFFDLIVYSLFAIAFSYIYGIQTPQNFNQPIKAKNIKDFWIRWHMSLSFWFRDCIYMRSLFFMSKKKLLKSQFAMSNIAFFL